MAQQYTMFPVPTEMVQKLIDLYTAPDCNNCTKSQKQKKMKCGDCNITFGQCEMCWNVGAAHARCAIAHIVCSKCKKSHKC